jgi:hypothetical protein
MVASMARVPLRVIRINMLAALVLAAVSSSGCGGGSDPNTGSLSLSLTDAPVDAASSVVVAFTGIELHRSDGTTVSVNFGTTNGQPTIKSIDLMKLQNGVTGILTQGAAVPAGDYEWMRLKVLADKNSQGESYITLLTGEQFPLWIPSGAETGLKLVRPFTVAQGSTTRLVIDFDLRKSVTAPPGQDPNYLLKPALRLLDELQVGKITANIDLSALAAAQLGAGAAISSCMAGLYLYSGGSAVPDDQDGDATDDGGSDPVLYQPIVYDGVNTNVSVTIPFIEVGSYTLAATCDFHIDAPETNDYVPNAIAGQAGYRTMKWTIVPNVSVATNSTTAVTLP